MVVDDFNAIRSILLPFKANAELIIDADTVLTTPVSLQRFQHISGRVAEIVKTEGRIHAVEFSPGYAFNTTPSPVCAGLCQFRRVAVFEAPDHVKILGCSAFNVKQHTPHRPRCAGVCL
jgi:hypothetical protein